MIPASAERDEDLGPNADARIRLPGEGPRRTVIILRTSAGSFVVRGDGQSRQEADRKARGKAIAFILAHSWDVT